MKKAVILAKLLLLIFLTSSSFATDRFISTTGTDSGNCASAPCRTFNYARTQVSSGDTLYFRAGSYPGMVLTTTARVPSGGGENSRTVIAGYPGEIVTFNSQVTISWGDAQVGVNESTIEYVTFRNFRVQGGGSGGLNIQGCANQLGTSWPFTPTCGAHHIRYEYIDVTVSGTSCVLTANSASSYIEYIRVTAHDCAGGQFDHGFYVSGLNLLFDGVEAYNNNGYGMHMYDNSSTCAGQHHCNTNNVVRNSSFHHNGITDGAGAVIGHGDNILFYNNILYNNRTGGIHATFGNSDNTQIYNNTIYNNGDWGISVGDTSSPSTQTNAKIKNNILLNNTNGAIKINLATGTTYATNMCTSLTTGCALTGIAAFEDAANGNFKLLESNNARNAGTDLSAFFTTDREGAARNQGAGWDIGAYEYTEGGGAPANGNPIYIAKTGDDNNSCIDAENPSTPKLTIMNAICNCAKFPGKRHIIKAGTYTESPDTGVCAITGGSGPSYTNATTIETYSNDAVTIKSAAGYGMALFLRASESYIVFKGSAANKLIFDGGGGGGNTIALYPGTHHIRFEYVEAKNADLFEVLYSLSASNIEIYDSLFHNGALDGIAIDGTSSGWIIQRVSSYSNGGVGISAPTYSGSHSGTLIGESRIYSNIGNGVEFGTSTGAVLWNNLIYSNTGMGVLFKNNSSGTQIYNSNLSGNTGEEFRCNTGATGIQIKNNIIWPNALTDNCGATKFANQTSDPLFVSFPSNQQLQDTSTAINTGTTLLNVTTDIAGTIRPQGINYDKGAYERDVAPSSSGSDVTVLMKSLRNRGMFFN